MDTKKASIFLVLFVSACTGSGGTLCTAGPIILDPDDALTRSTKEQIVALNNSGKELCGWVPISKGE